MTVHPNPGQEHIPTGTDKSCGDILYLDLDGIRLGFVCQIEELKDEHPGQPHMVRLPAVEQGDEVFLGWWHNPLPPQPARNVYFTRTPEEDD